MYRYPLGGTSFKNSVYFPLLICELVVKLKLSIILLPLNSGVIVV